MPDPFGKNAGRVTIKGGRASRSQRQILARALRYADKIGAPYKAKQALIAALIVESEAKNLSTPSADGYGSYGVLQGLERYHSRKNLMNPEYQFGVFLGRNKKYPKGFTGKGNAVQLAKTGMSPGDIAQAVEGSAYPDRYGQVMNEANKIIRLYRTGGGGSAVPSRGGKSSGGAKSGGITAGSSLSSGPDAATLSALLSYTRQKREGRSVKDLASALVGAESQVETAPSVPKMPKMPKVGGAKQSGGSSGGSGGVPKSKGGGKSSQIYEMFYDPGFSWDSGRRSGPIGNHTNHVHVAADSRRVVYLGRVAQRMGLSVREHPKFDKVDPVHTDGSFHYKNQAIDVSGDPRKMRAFNRYVKKAYNLR